MRRYGAMGYVGPRAIVSVLGWQPGDRLTLTAGRVPGPGRAGRVLVRGGGSGAANPRSVPRDRKTVLTFAEYVPVVSSSVTAGTRRAYGSYWNRVLEHWGDRRLDEPTRRRSGIMGAGQLLDT